MTPLHQSQQRVVTDSSTSTMAEKNPYFSGYDTDVDTVAQIQRHQGSSFAELLHE